MTDTRGSTVNINANKCKVTLRKKKVIDFNFCINKIKRFFAILKLNFTLEILYELNIIFT